MKNGIQEGEAAYCTFRVGDSMCGVPVSRVREIVSDLVITPVPRASDSVAGLINLRGQILTVIEMRDWLSLNSNPDDTDSRFHLITEVGSELVSLCVDEMGPVVSPKESEMELVPTHVDPQVSGRIDAVARMPDQLVLLLKVEQIKEMRTIPLNGPRLQAEKGPKKESLQSATFGV
ncbi:chemotaxis protein CheW [bacterium]|nr:chemotaxis protein CheW [bacterium]